MSNERNDGGPSIPVSSFDEWYRMAGEFFKNAMGATFEQLENGHKALTLAYMGMPEAADLTPIQLVKARAIFNLAGKRLLDAEYANEARQS